MMIESQARVLGGSICITDVDRSAHSTHLN